MTMVSTGGVTVVLGAQWGDEGKGKLCDILAHESHVVCRSAGGNNAGHTIEAEGKTYSFHGLPSGLLAPQSRNLIGTGCVVHIPSIFAEIETLTAQGLRPEGRVFISDRAHVVFDLHQLVDGLEELELKGNAVGTTKKGIGPTYSTKASRSGVRIGELLDKQTTDRKLRILAHGYQTRFSHLLKYDVEAEIKKLDLYRERLAPLVIDAVPFIVAAQARNESILVEGGQALLLDIDAGTYPYVTSSSTGLAGVLSGLGGIRLRNLKNIIGVVKVYSTRVGGGPFPTEQLNEHGEALQSIGHEFGATTGRKRRTGWLDMVSLRYSTAVNDYTSLNLTKLDVLDTFAEIQVAVSYKLTKTGRKTETLESFPSQATTLELLDGDVNGKGKLEVEYKTFKGWQTDITKCKTWDDLPAAAQAYVQFIEQDLNVPVKWIGVGAGRTSMIVR